MRRWSLLFIVALAAGCTTSAPVYEHDGVRYGVTEGPFRGRWWNYYERGRSFLDGGFYAEARRDFAQALKERDGDQRWARTYGMHFAPQYFPNREYGIALYHAGDYTGAITALERSYGQQPSARAACYLQWAREKVSSGDTTAPVVEIAPAEGNSTVSTRTAELSIRAEDDTYIATVAVNGESLDVGAPQPRFQQTLPIPAHAGENIVQVRVTDVAGNVAERAYEFTADFEGPAISFDEPVVLPGTVRGVAADPAGITQITIAGVAATLSTGAGGVYRFSATLNPSDLTAPPTFSATDGLGNRSMGSLPVGIVHVAEAPAGFVLAGGPVLVPLGNRLSALFEAGRLIAVARTPDPGQEPVVRFTNLAEGQRYLMGEIVVDLDLAAPAGIQQVTLNGAPVFCLEGRTHQRVSRRVALPKDGAVEIVAQLEDLQGGHSETRVTVQRVMTEVESLSNKLSLAVLGNIWEGPNRGESGEESFIADELTRVLYEEGRFDLVSRTTLPQILTEQELNTIIRGRNGAAPLSGLVGADLLVAGLVRRDTDSIEIILEAISPESSQLMGYADVAGAAKTKDELRALVADLALRFTQEFPKVQGDVVDVRSQSKLFATLSRADRVRPNMKCLIFRHGPPVIDPATGTELGRPAEILAEGWFANVSGTLSTVQVGHADGGEEADIEVHDLVVTK